MISNRNSSSRVFPPSRRGWPLASANGSSSRRAAALGLLAALASVIILAAPRAASAFELKLWPLVDFTRRAGETRLSLLGPLVEWRSDAEADSFAVRPLFTSTRERSSGRARGTALYPVAWWESNRDDFFFRFLGLVSYDALTRPPPSRPWTRQFTVYPLIFFRHGPEAGTSLSVLPFYADVTDFFGFERIRMVLFPLYLRLVEPLYERTWLPFPFVSWTGGRAGSGWRLWPVYGHTSRGREVETTFVAWPAYIRQDLHVGNEGQVTNRISWPLFSSIDGPDLESRSYGFLLLFPLYTHTLDRRGDKETFGFPWPLWTFQRSLKSGEFRSLRFAPFFQDRRTESLRSVFVLWPLYRHRTGSGEDAKYERSDFLLLLYRNQSESQGPGELHTRVLFPFWVSRNGPSGGRVQVITLADGLLPKNDKIETLYAPLYRLYGSETAGDRSSHDLLWKMWEWGGGKFRPPWYFSLD